MLTILNILTQSVRAGREFFSECARLAAGPHHLIAISFSIR